MVMTESLLSPAQRRSQAPELHARFDILKEECPVAEPP